MSVYLARLARFSFTRRRLVVGVWLAIVVAVIVGAQLSGGKTVDDFSVPGTQSQRSVDVLKSRIPALGGAATQAVLVAPAGRKMTDPAEVAALDQVAARLARTRQVSIAVNPVTAHLVSPDGEAAMMQVQYTVDASAVDDSTLTAVSAAYAPARAIGMKVAFGGAIYPGSRPTMSELPELIGIAIGVIILMITFGSVLVSFLPIVTAIVGVITALMGISIVASITPVATVSTALMTMLGLSCGIDYALFIVSRHRNNLMAGDSLEDSIALAAGTAGSAVVFAASAVIIALLGLAVVRVPFLTVMGLAAGGAVLLSLTIALTLLPALLGFCGMRVITFVRFAPAPEHTERTAWIAAHEPHRTLGARWGSFISAHRVLTAAAAVTVMLVIAIPLLSLSLGLPSGRSQPAAETSHIAYDLTTDHFGVGANSALIVVADLTHQTSSAAGQEVVAALRAEPGVTGAVLARTANHTALIQVTPTTGPNDSRTTDLVKRIRRDATAVEARTGTRILVGGTTASNIDTSRKLADALPVFLLVVIGLAFVLLTFAFRTILVPITSILGFLLSVAAAFGAEVAVFQWGWLKGVLGVEPGQTLSFLPVMGLAIVFGLSSDYEVFVVSRIKEDFSRTNDALGSVVRGVGNSARVVSAAALIMFSVFVAFVFNPNPPVKSIGVTLAVAVFLDAFLMRLTLVPALMSLIKSRFWYHPRWFAAHVPDLDIEGEKLEQRMHSDPPRELATADR